MNTGFKWHFSDGKIMCILEQCGNRRYELINYEHEFHVLKWIEFFYKIAIYIRQNFSLYSKLLKFNFELSPGDYNIQFYLTLFSDIVPKNTCNFAESI